MIWYNMILVFDSMKWNDWIWTIVQYINSLLCILIGDSSKDM